MITSKRMDTGTPILQIGQMVTTISKLVKELRGKLTTSKVFQKDITGKFDTLCQQLAIASPSGSPLQEKQIVKVGGTS
jgi:hypothetical protein